MRTHFAVSCILLVLSFSDSNSKVSKLLLVLYLSHVGFNGCYLSIYSFKLLCGSSLGLATNNNREFACFSLFPKKYLKEIEIGTIQLFLSSSTSCQGEKHPLCDIPYGVLGENL